MIGSIFLLSRIKIQASVPLPKQNNNSVPNSITIEGKEIFIEYARTRQEQQTGLMNRKFLDENAGMLFVFSMALPQSFWNQNTLIPLDVIWIRNGVVIGVSALPNIQEQSKTIFSPGLADQVLEVNAGFANQYNIKRGSIIK